MTGRETYEFIEERLARGETVILMTVAASASGSPGKPGFKMAVGADGRLIGSIGGGSLEYRAVEQARKMLKADEQNPRIQRQNLDGTAMEDGSSMICGGSQTIMFYPCKKGDLAVVRRIIAAVDSCQTGAICFSNGTWGFEESGQAGVCGIEFRMDESGEWVYTERLGVPDTVNIFGGGHVCLALSRILATLDFRILVFDDRPELPMLEENRFVDERYYMSFDAAVERVAEGENSYVVIMTPSHRADEDVLRGLIDKRLKYLGLMASRVKAGELFENLRRYGVSRERLNFVSTPVGLPIGSRTPAEIAVSIAAELIEIRNMPPAPATTIC